MRVKTYNGNILWNKKNDDKIQACETKNMYKLTTSEKYFVRTYKNVINLNCEKPP